MKLLFHYDSDLYPKESREMSSEDIAPPHKFTIEDWTWHAWLLDQLTLYASRPLDSVCGLTHSDDLITQVPVIFAVVSASFSQFLQHPLAILQYPIKPVLLFLVLWLPFLRCLFAVDCALYARPPCVTIILQKQGATEVWQSCHLERGKEYFFGYRNGHMRATDTSLINGKYLPTDHVLSLET